MLPPESLGAPSTYHTHAAIARDPDLASDRAKRDAELLPEVQRVWDDNHEVYGVRKVWRQMQREDFDIARCTVERLMKQLEIQGVMLPSTSTFWVHREMRVRTFSNIAIRVTIYLSTGLMAR